VSEVSAMFHNVALPLGFALVLTGWTSLTPRQMARNQDQADLPLHDRLHHRQHRRHRRAHRRRAHRVDQGRAPRRVLLHAMLPGSQPEHVRDALA
jgi:hypothetical protein